MAICPRCSAVFDKNATQTFEEQKKAKAEREKERVKQERKEVKKKLAKREVVVARLRRDIVGKQKVVIDTKKLGLNMVQPSMGTNQKVKIVVVVDQNPEGVQMRTRVPPSNVVNNKWIHNTRKAPGPYI